MAQKERYQNPAQGDTVRLRLFVFNSNNKADPTEIRSVSIYFLDPSSISDYNPCGRCLLTTITDIQQDCLGSFYVDVYIDPDIFSIGNFVDVWDISFDSEQETEVVNRFEVYSSLWYSSPIPVVYDFTFYFRPNKIRKGEKKFIQIEIEPLVPTATDLQRYYENLAIVSCLKISIEKTCNSCGGAFSDLDIVVDEEKVDFREKKFGYYQIDSTDWDCGIYYVWFTLEMGGNTFISSKEALQIIGS